MVKSKEQIEETLEKFKEVALNEYPIQKINGLISDLGAFPTPSYILHPGKRIVRARLNRDWEPFTTKSEVNYVPADCNNSYQRASTPEQNMFYGAVLPENLDPEEVRSERITTACETSELWNKTPESIEKEVLTFSSWVVKEDIPLVAIINPTDKNENKTKLTQDLYDMFWELIYSDEEKLLPTVQATQFFANEFSKEVDFNAPDYNYLISAVISNNIVNGGAAGVVYPSVKTSAKSVNVAISPEFADRCLELDMVLQCKMHKLKSYSIVSNELIATSIEDAESFEYQKIEDPRYNPPEEKIHEQLRAAT